MKFCCHCGHTVSIEVPPGDHLPRHVCGACHTVHYQNPRIIVGCVPVWEEQILICRRAIEPRHGYWTLPAGFMENGETVQDGAARESREEALADVEIGSLLAVINVVHVHQVHIMFRARLRNRQFGVGEESLEVKLVHADEIPWDDLAFGTVRFSLQRFLEDRAAQREPMHLHTIP
jgi:ADP-ribose pyrophosphatase YjhB (NUDIX family)